MKSLRSRLAGRALPAPLAASLVVGLGLGVMVVAEADTSSPAFPHDFHFNSAAQTYTINGAAVSVADVKRDVSGALCSKCHAEAVGQLKASVHFTTQAPTQRVLFPGGGGHGMLDRACGLPGSSAMVNYVSDPNLAECGKCHIGRYLPVMQAAFEFAFATARLPNAAGQAERVVNAGLDCLICHSAQYKAVPEGTLASVAAYAKPGAEAPVPAGFPRVAHDDGDFDQDGVRDPMLDRTGDGIADVPLMMDTDGDGMPDAPWPTIAQDRSPDAVLSVGATSEKTCLRCHEHARTGYKRATLFAAGYDVHATATSGTFAGAKNRCTVCHTASDHKFARGHNVGGDLAAADYPPPAIGVVPGVSDPTDVSCVQCHDPGRLTGQVHSTRHIDRIACETCHIPASGGIAYSLYGQGGHLLFGRNDKGHDTKLITADHTWAEDEADIAADFEAYRMRPTLVWFNGGASFLAQTLAVRGSPNAKITPFKPMANGMVFDARFFRNETVTNALGVPYNAYSMYRFYANGSNADVFSALKMVDLTPNEVRGINLMDLMPPPPPLQADPRRQAMAMMLLFPNMLQFDKQTFGFEHYLVGTGSRWDPNKDGIIDAGLPFTFDMLKAANMGLAKFQGFNQPMGLPPDYQWYPFLDSVSQPITMKVPDESLIRMFLQMQGASDAATRYYPAFSNGVTLGGHGVRPKEQALGAGRQGCMDCHGEGGALSTPVPVTRKVLSDLGMGMKGEMPLYQWKFYNARALIDLGLKTQNEDVAAGRASVDIDGKLAYVRVSGKQLLLNWFVPNAPGGYLPADHAAVLKGTGLKSADLAIKGGPWMAVLEPVVDYVPNYLALGYTRDEVIFRRRR